MYTSNDARAAADRLRPSVHADGRIGDPLPIIHDGETRGWFAPLLNGPRLTGFFQLDEALTFVRFSTFPSSIDPRQWLDTATITERALRAFPNERVIEEPFLTWDRKVTRLAWAVPATGGRIYVTGNRAYRGN